MKIVYKLTSVIIFVVFLSPGLFGQNNCSDKLKAAKQLFESGQIEQIPTLLDSCLHKGFTSKEKIIAYKLLIQTYLFDYNQTKADETMVRFMKEFPNYIINESDPPEIKELYELFYKKPEWSFEILAGSNVSNIITKQYYVTSNYNNLSNKNKIGIGYCAGLQATRYIGANFAVSIGAKFIGSQYQNIKDLNNGSTHNEFKEVTNWVNIPVNVIYFKHFKKSNLSPFVFCGAEFGMVIQSKADITSVNNFSGNISKVKGTDVDFTASRNKTNIWISSGIGLKYKMSSGSFKVWTGFNYGLNSFARDDMRYSNYNTILYYQHIDDDFIYNHIFLNVSYSLDIYQIIKRQ